MYPDAMAENDERRRVILPCVQCGKPGVAGIEVPGGQGYNLCFEHLQQHEELRLRKIEMYGHLADRFADDIADTMGMPRRPRPQRVPAARVNVHQIHIHGNNLGVVNTGTVQTIENNVTAINQVHPALAQHLRQLAEGILASDELTDDDKRNAAELLNEVVAEATKSGTERRSRVVMQTIANGLGQVLAKAAQLASIWKAIEPHLLQ
jgi:hypothetical protein